jgi:hydroxypyruvate reductase
MIVMEENLREDLQEILRTALDAAEPGRAVRRFLSVEGRHIVVGEESFEPRSVSVLAVGKAAGAMARAAGEVLKGRMAGALCVTKTGHEGAPEPFETLYAAHPEPDAGSVEAARRVEELLDSLEEGDLLLVLVSGGASALLADAVPEVGLVGLKELTGALLKSGAAIGEINAIRKHVSTLKGGNLIQKAAPARVVALLLSDVVGDDPSAIGSGLTAPDPTTLADVSRILDRYGVQPPASVAAHLEKSLETPKPGDPVFEGVSSLVVGGGRLTAVAAAEKARELGYEPLLLSTYFMGDARDLAGLHAGIVKEVLASGNPASRPCAIVTGGEATVVVRGGGTGGPNQEFALALAVELEGVDSWAALAVDTDGNDGPTDAAGGLVSGGTAEIMRRENVDPQAALDDNDAYGALEISGALVKTGPTGTNVNDLRVVLVGGDS